MASLTFIKAGINTTIQDLGRPGLAFYAIPKSGALDSDSIQRANLILSNPLGNACIESLMGDMNIQFHDNCTICISGSNVHWFQNESAIDLDTPIQIRSGDIIKCNNPFGHISYLAIQGDFETSKHFKSQSAYSFASLGAHEGQPFKNGDVLKFNATIPEINQSLKFAEAKTDKFIEVNRGPEFGILDESAISAITGNSFAKSIQSNRMGIRLEEVKIEHEVVAKLPSLPLLPGFIQLFPNGQLNVVLYDGQTTGGYPRILYMKENELNKLCRLSFNEEFSFELVN